MPRSPSSPSLPVAFETNASASSTLVGPTERAFAAWEERGDVTGLVAVARDEARCIESGAQRDEAARALFADVLEALGVSDPDQAMHLAHDWLRHAEHRQQRNAIAIASLCAAGEARRMAQANPSTVALLERALAASPESLALRARLAARLSAEHHAASSGTQRRDARDLALHCFSELGPIEKLRVLTIRYNDVYEHVPALERHLLTQSYLAAMPREPSPWLRLRGAVFRLDQLMAAGFFERFDELVQPTEELALRLSDHWSHHHVRHRRADRAIVAGDFASAQSLITQGMQARHGGPDQFAREWWFMLSMSLSGDLGRDVCPPPFLQLFRSSAWIGARCAVAFHAWEVGQHAVAQDMLEKLDGDVATLGDLPQAHSNAAQLAHVAFQLGHKPYAQRLLEVLQPVAGTLIERNRGLSHGPADLSLGMLWSLLGDAAQALTYLERAEQSARAVASPIWRARALHAAALCCERAGPSRRGQAELLHARCRSETDALAIRCLFERTPRTANAELAGVQLVLERLSAGARLLVVQAHAAPTELPLGERAADLLLMLAKAEAADGFVADEELITRIWPRQAKSRVDLNVLIHRTRQSLERAAIPLAITRHNAGTKLVVEDEVAFVAKG